MILSSVSIFSAVIASAQLAVAWSVFRDRTSHIHGRDDLPDTPGPVSVQMTASNSGTSADGQNLVTGSADYDYVGFGLSYDDNVTIFTLGQGQVKTSEGNLLYAYTGYGDPGPVVIADPSEDLGLLSHLSCQNKDGFLGCSAFASDGVTVMSNFQLVDENGDGNLELAIGSAVGDSPVSLAVGAAQNSK